VRIVLNFHVSWSELSLNRLIVFISWTLVVFRRRLTIPIGLPSTVILRIFTLAIYFLEVRLRLLSSPALVASTPAADLSIIIYRRWSFTSFISIPTLLL
jgi:hypothetical protein